MKTFSIVNPRGGVDLGRYEGETEGEALDAMAREAGYADYNDLKIRVGADDDLEVEEVDDEGVEVDPSPCKTCDGPMMVMGPMGSAHYALRCQDCGITVVRHEDAL